MASSNGRTDLPTPVGIGVGIVLFVSLAFAFVTGNLFLWLVGAVALGPSIYAFFLFYRLVIAVEEIADKL